ncbi:unnamed protein product [Arabis nemorensis]|uniref:Uncharacterized protein n=1 Tax=Arabis nemorensis TaxID=586526 RepID=A0A565CAJ9_9BRAS|nr:unnamed protein product [Arabis nemorensis]
MVELLIHYGGTMLKENDDYKYLDELGHRTDILAEMKKVNYVLENMMEDMHELCYIGDVGGIIEVFLEHECSEAVPGVIPYLVSSQHEDKDRGDEETEGEKCKKVLVEDGEEKAQKAREAEESDEDYRGYMRGDAKYPDTPVPSDEEWDEWADKKR